MNYFLKEKNWNSFGMVIASENMGRRLDYNN